MELLAFIEQVVKNFSRYNKYTIGTRLRDACWEVTTLIVQANNTSIAERLPLLIRLRDKIEEVNIGLAVAKELKAFAKYNSYRHAAKLAVDVSRQSEGWLKSVTTISSPES